MGSPGGGYFAIQTAPHVLSSILQRATIVSAWPWATRRSPERKTTRRQRIRLLVRLARLTEAHPSEVLEDRTTGAHAELVGILRTVAEKARTG
jgi:hypothetical protein